MAGHYPRQPAWTLQNWNLTEDTQKGEERGEEKCWGPDLRRQKKHGGQRVDPLLDASGSRERDEYDVGRVGNFILDCILC